MSNAAVMQQSIETAADWKGDYLKLIQEVYIDPIRSVVIVDDEFPTLDAFINKHIETTKAAYVAPISNLTATANVETVHDILSFCRTRKRPWLVDIHDGREVDVDEEINIASHMHHSDLMILDYHLLGENGGGEKSIKILRKLAYNPHFNIVVVYTKGYSGGDIKQVFNEIATALTYRNFRFLLEEEFKRVKDAVGEWEEKNDSIFDTLLELIAPSIYLQERCAPGTVNKGEIGNRIRELLRKDEIKNLDSKCVINYVLDLQHEKISKAMSGVDFGHAYFSFSEDANWIKTDSLFVTVVNKSQKADEIEEKIKAALMDFCPGPHQLLMAKMRAEIDETGVAAELAVLSNRYMQAGWLSDLFDKSTNDRQIIKDTIDRHWEALGDQLKIKIDDFASRLIQNVGLQGEDSIMQKYAAGLKGETDQILSHINSYNSTKPVSHSHLMTGHVLKFLKEDQSSYELWICLSPACDLVPGQKSSGWRGRLGDSLPFMAVHLTELKKNKALEKITDNIHLFLEIEKDVKTFTFCPDGNPQSSPLWEQMFALNQGRFAPGSNAVNTVNICRIISNAGSLVSITQEATVVAQLRYEYALNLLQRLGATFSRVGLDFKPRPTITSN